MGSCVLRETIRKGRPRGLLRVFLYIYLSIYPPPRVGSLFCSAGCISLLLRTSGVCLIRSGAVGFQKKLHSQQKKLCGLWPCVHRRPPARNILSFWHTFGVERLRDNWLRLRTGLQWRCTKRRPLGEFGKRAFEVAAPRHELELVPSSHL